MAERIDLAPFAPGEGVGIWNAVISKYAPKPTPPRKKPRAPK